MIYKRFKMIKDIKEYIKENIKKIYIKEYIKENLYLEKE